MEGFLYKQSDTLKQWRRRWFRLVKNSSWVEYKEQPTDKAMRGNIPLVDVSVGPMQPPQNHLNWFCFYMKGPTFVYALAAENEEAARRWMDLIVVASAMTTAAASRWAASAAVRGISRQGQLEPARLSSGASEALGAAPFQGVHSTSTPGYFRDEMEAGATPRTERGSELRWEEGAEDESRPRVVVECLTSAPAPQNFGAGVQSVVECARGGGVVDDRGAGLGQPRGGWWGGGAGSNTPGMLLNTVTRECAQLATRFTDGRVWSQTTGELPVVPRILSNGAREHASWQAEIGRNGWRQNHLPEGVSQCEALLEALAAAGAALQAKERQLEAYARQVANVRMRAEDGASQQQQQQQQAQQAADNCAVKELRDHLQQTEHRASLAEAELASTKEEMQLVKEVNERLQLEVTTLKAELEQREDGEKVHKEMERQYQDRCLKLEGELEGLKARVKGAEDTLMLPFWVGKGTQKASS